MKRLVLSGAALVTALLVLIPEDASAYWRAGWRGPGWGGYRMAAWGGYRPIYGPWAVAMAPGIIVTHPVSYGYAIPYPLYGGFYGGYYGYRGCVTNNGYGRYSRCQ